LINLSGSRGNFAAAYFLRILRTINDVLGTA